MKHLKAICPVLKGQFHKVMLLVLIVLITALILSALTACGKQNAGESDETKVSAASLESAETGENTAAFQPDKTDVNTVSSQQPTLNEVWDDLFLYDETESVQFNVRATIPGEEEAYEYPWGDYDGLDYIDPDSKTAADVEPSKSPDPGEANEKLQKALESLSPEKRKIAEEAMAKAQNQIQSPVNSPEETELPPDWNDESNQPVLGGRLELQNGETRVIIEMSEYCVEKDIVFTVTPIKENKLKGEIIKSGFSLTAGEQKHILLNDYAVVTFLTKQDPGDDIVIKSFNPDGTMEYSAAEITSLGGIFQITGAVEHFSTVGYGNAELSPEAAAALNESAHRELIEASRRLHEKWEYEKKAADEYKSRKFLQTIEFDEIIFTTSATGDPLQLHLRAKLVESPYELNPATNMPESYFTGKVWLKFYTWMPEGYGDIYMICNNAKIPTFYGLSYNVDMGDPTASAVLQMTTIGGSKTRYALDLRNYKQAGYTGSSGAVDIYSPFSNVISHNMPAWSKASQWATGLLQIIIVCPLQLETGLLWRMMINPITYVMCWK